MTGSGAGYDPGAATHRALREIRRELGRHPLVGSAEGFPPNAYARVEADHVLGRLGRSVEWASMVVRWYAGDEPEAPPAFSFHYTDASGLERGWHHEPNPHVDQWGHYQERAAGAEAYRYEPYSFSSLVPSRVVWEVLSQLETE